MASGTSLKIGMRSDIQQRHTRYIKTHTQTLSQFRPPVLVGRKNGSTFERLSGNSMSNIFNPIPPGGGGGGGGKCLRRLQLSRTSLIFKQYLPNVATFTKIYWRTRFWKNFASRASHVATEFSTPCLLEF